MSSLIAFSLVAHEKPSVLLGQLQNIRNFNPGCLIALHVNQDFRLNADAERWISRLTEEPGVILNPQSLRTSWAHIFHAHLSNLWMLRRVATSFDYVVLLSSGDLFFRTGLSEHLEGFDMAIGGHPMAADWGGGAFSAAAEADEKLADLRAGLPSGNQLFHSLHEGSAFRKSLVYNLLDEVDSIAEDWSDEVGYPREEIVLPTLLAKRQGLVATRPAAVHLASYCTPTWLCCAVAQALRQATAGINSHAVESLLPAWLDAHSDEVLDTTVFILSRVPRVANHALRRVMEGAIAKQAVSIDTHDLLDLELPGRAMGQLNHHGLSPITRAAILARLHGENIIHKIEGSGNYILPACHSMFSPELRGPLALNTKSDIASQPFLAASDLKAPLETEAISGPKGLELHWKATAEGRILLCIPVPEESNSFDHLLLVLGSVSGSPPILADNADVEWWIEEHESSSQGQLLAKKYKRKIAICLQRDKGSVHYVLPSCQQEVLNSRRVIYLASRAANGGMSVIALYGLSLKATR